VHFKKIQTSVLLALLTVIFLAWGYLFHQHWQMNAQSMADMWMPPVEIFAWSYLDFSLVFLMWAIMMAAMMLPSAIPMILATTRINRQRKTKYYQLTFIFTLAYLCVWFSFSGLLTLLQWQMHGLAWLSPMMENQNPLLAAGILILAGIYQFLPVKNVCLRHCRTPMSFLLNEWKNGYLGTLTMGLKHGTTCLGCCWAQMLIMFSVGVMNLFGMAIITLIILLEKLAPIDPKHISRIGGLAFVLWGICIFSPVIGDYVRKLV
jgi:predicted metal-binding membrane protein